MRISAKKGLHQLLDACRGFGVKKVVISPGSRNAPLTVSFNQHLDFECLSIPDERVAGFFAMGLALSTQAPVAVLCTSGSAVLNLAPAIAEAYYQQIPLVVLTADRPLEWVNQGEGQTIDQTNLFKNFIRASCTLLAEPGQPDQIWHNRRILAETFTKAVLKFPGPLHINIPLREPLYEFIDSLPESGSTGYKVLETGESLSAEKASNLALQIENASSVLVLTGQSTIASPELETALQQLAKLENVAVLTETSSNVEGTDIISTIDRLITPLQQTGTGNYNPELLITIGGNIISRRIKALLRKNPPAEHWHFGQEEIVPDTYQCLSLAIPVKPGPAFAEIAEKIRPENIRSDYRLRWQELKSATSRSHTEFISTAPFSDLKVFDLLQEFLPEGTVVHMGNSSPVRYLQLMGAKKGLIYQGNRGTSGIDGSTSTAAGYALGQPEHKHLLISGDLAFMYDSNAFWNKHFPQNLKIIVINNGGGGIFRIIQGPDTTDELEEFFETSHPGSVSGIAHTFGIHYSKAETEQEVVKNLSTLLNLNSAGILEIVTPKHENARVLQNYFEHLRKNIT